MKKFLLLLAVLSIPLGAMSQKGKVTSALSFIDQGLLDKAKEALDEAMVNEKTKEWFNTYFAKGKLCQSSFESDNAKFKSLCGNNPLAEAYAAYEKSISLDPKGTVKKRIITNMVYNSLAVDLFTQGSQQFSTKDFEGALQSFETQIEITESDKFAGAIDTGMYYNAGLAAINSNKYDKAIKYFEKCAEMKYQGIRPYYQIYESYLAMGDTAKAEATLMDLPNKFPGDKTVTLQLIDLYLKSGKNDEALKYINVAKQDDPENHSLYYAAGIMFLNQEKFDEAIVELTRAVELKSDFFDSQYALAVSYINKAASMYQKANDIMDVKEYNAAVEKANEVYAKALPYMERAHELKPDDSFALQGLQELYYRLKMTDKYNEIKAKREALEKK